MSSRHSNHSPRLDHGYPGQDRSAQLATQQNIGNEPTFLRAPLIDGRSEISPPSSPVSSLSEHDHHISGPASSENRSLPSSAEPDEKELQHPPLNQPAWWSRLIADSWILEIISGFVSFASIASIVGVLGAYNQKPVPPLIHGITLNAVISFLATISRSAIMLCVGTVLSQGKWLWFKKKQRSLIDLQTIEDASRGPLGSVVMLFLLRGGAVASIAAIVTVATLGFDPFVQQLLTTEHRVVSVPASGIAINSTTSMTVDIYAAMDYPETIAQLTAAMFADVQQEDQPKSVIAASSPVGVAAVKRRSETTTQTLASLPRADCPSGNCVWQPYYALDICSQCRTTTDELTIKNLSPNSSDLSAMISAAQRGQVSASDLLRSNFTWEIIPKFGRKWQVTSNLSSYISSNDLSGSPAGLSISGTIVRKLVWPLNFASSDGILLDTTGWTEQPFAGIDQPVAALGFAEFDFSDDGLLVLNQSLECAVTYCVHEYNRSVVQGNLVSNVLSTHYGKVTGDPNALAADLTWSANVNGTTFQADPFLMYGTGIGALTGYMLGNSTRNYRGSCLAENNWACSASPTSNDGEYSALKPEAWQGLGLSQNFTAVLENINTVVSGIVQQYGNVTVPGANAVNTEFVVVRWAWIALPAAVVLLGLIDQRSLANRLAAASSQNDDNSSGKDLSREDKAAQEDATLPAKLHGNEPSRGAKIDKEIADEEAEIIAKKDAKKEAKK
ncbi:hypothetical protein DV738_g2762, partial [Chaetothyriales sp. CBS 135597]